MSVQGYKRTLATTAASEGLKSKKQTTASNSSDSVSSPDRQQLLEHFNTEASEELKPKKQTTASMTSDLVSSPDRQQLLERFKSIKLPTVSPRSKTDVAKKTIHANVRILIWEGMIAAIEFFNLYAIHRFLKGEAEYQEIANTFGRGLFFKPQNLEGLLRKGNRKLPAKLVVPSQGSWYLISARDDFDVFVERAESLRHLWEVLSPALNDGKSMENQNYSIDCTVTEDCVNDEEFEELCFIHYNTRKQGDL